MALIGAARRRRRGERRRTRSRLGPLMVLLVLAYVGLVAAGRWYRVHRLEVLHTLAWVGPLVLALLCGLVALAIRARIRTRRREEAEDRIKEAQSHSIAALDASGDRTGKSLERITRDLLERDGWEGARVVGGAGDLGADNLADGYRGTPCPLVLQDKQYAPTDTVGSKDLQAFAGTCWTMHGAQLAVFVTTARGYTQGARKVAEANHILLITHDELAAAMAGQRPLIPADVTSRITALGGAA